MSEKREALRAKVAAAIGALLREAVPLGPEAGTDANLHGAFADAALGAVEGEALLVLEAPGGASPPQLDPWPEAYEGKRLPFGFDPATPIPEDLAEVGEWLGKAVVGSILAQQELQSVGAMASRIFCAQGWEGETFADAAKDAWELWQAVKDATPVPIISDAASH